MKFKVEWAPSIAEDLTPLMADFARETSREIPWEPHTPDTLAQGGYLVFTARHFETLVGFCLVRPVKDGAVDAGMYLAPEHRRGWTAIRLARFVERSMARLGAKWMTWECDEESGSSALADYLHHKCISRRYFVALEVK